ncbi:MAG: nuclear transport factor 2 family protein [Chloroflexi bacterium]|nr:nuclear transport factor 2 family protein [Chloroflexota bacterium]
MLKVSVNADCGNAPKKLLLRDLNIAFARADVEGILDKFTEDIRWRIIGEADLRGKAAVREALEKMQNVLASELVIHSIITQGREGAVNGVITMEQGGSVAFCDVCQFASAAGKKIKLMKSYAVEIKTED